MKNIKKILLLIIACFLQYQGFSQTPPPPTELRCDLMKNTDRVFINGELSQISLNEIDKIIEPSQLAFIESKRPVFSWIMEDQRNNTMQTGFHIQIGTSQNEMVATNEYSWNSGKINSQKSLVKYGGKDLKPNMNYYWRVKVWNNHGDETAWSKIIGFRTGKELKDYSSGAYPIQQRDEYPQFTKRINPNLQFIDFGKAAFGRVKLTVDSKLKGNSLLINVGEVITKHGRIDENQVVLDVIKKLLYPLYKESIPIRLLLKRKNEIQATPQLRCLNILEMFIHSVTAKLKVKQLC